MKCRMVLTYDAYNESLEKEQEKETEVQKLKEEYEKNMKSMREEMNQQFTQIISMMGAISSTNQYKTRSALN